MVCDKVVCDKVVCGQRWCVKESAQSGRGPGAGYRIKKQEPHRKMWGKRLGFCSIGNLIHFVSACHKCPDSWNHSVHVASWHFFGVSFSEQLFL